MNPLIREVLIVLKYKDWYINFYKKAKVLIIEKNLLFKFLLNSDNIYIYTYDYRFVESFDSFIDLCFKDIIKCPCPSKKLESIYFGKYEISFWEDGISIRHVNSPWYVVFSNASTTDRMNYLRIVNTESNENYYIHEQSLKDILIKIVEESHLGEEI